MSSLSTLRSGISNSAPSPNTPNRAPIFPVLTKGAFHPLQHRDNLHARPVPERHDKVRMDSTPHVNKDTCFGHDRPDDRHYYIAHPFEHGHFEHFGPSYRYNIERFDRDARRFWLPGGFYFEVAPWD